MPGRARGRRSRACPRKRRRARPGAGTRLAVYEGFWELFCERLQGTVVSGRQDQLREEAGHDEALPELAEGRLGPLPCCDCEGQLRKAAPCRGRKGEGPAEARIDVGDPVGAVRL